MEGLKELIILLKGIDASSSFIGFLVGTGVAFCFFKIYLPARSKEQELEMQYRDSIKADAKALVEAKERLARELTEESLQLSRVRQENQELRNQISTFTSRAGDSESFSQMISQQFSDVKHSLNSLNQILTNLVALLKP